MNLVHFLEFDEETDEFLVDVERVSNRARKVVKAKVKPVSEIGSEKLAEKLDSLKLKQDREMKKAVLS